jgi:SAM-dependent methyltransferase
MKTWDEEWRARFERFGRTYTEEHEVSGWSAEGLTRRFSLFAEVFGQLPLPKRATILELGCGAGTYVRYLAGLGHSVVGVDYALATLRRALEAYEGRGAHYVAANGYALPFGPGSFDMVVCIGVLQAVSRPGCLLDEVGRILRPQGIILVEALNALELQAMARRLLEVIKGRPPRLHCYSPSQVRRWLKRREIKPLRRVGVYLPPRQFPGLGRILDWPGVIWLLEGIPGCSLMGAHAFWLVGQKSS